VRIALVAERFEPAGGGIEHALWNVAHTLAEAGDQVHVIARRGHSTPAVELHRVRAPAFWQPARVGVFSRNSREQRRGWDFDVVHSFSRTRHQDVFHAGCGCHAAYMRHTYGALGARLRRASPRHAVLLELERQVFRDERQTLQCVSEMVKGEIQARFGVPDERLEVIEYGVDCERFHPDRYKGRATLLRRALGSKDARVWLFAGSGWRRKGLDTALTALSLCEDRGAHLWVAGLDATAPWRALAERLGVLDRVRFVGARPDLEVFYAAADGLLFPSRYDAFGLVCLEAAATSRAVLTSRATGAAGLVADAGSVVGDAADAASFARQMERLSEPLVRDRLAARGREIALANTWAHHADRLRALYRRRAQ